MSGKLSNVPLKGIVTIELRDEAGNLKVRRHTRNIVTQNGNQYYADRASGVTTPNQVTGMRLGTGTTAAATTGAGAAIVTHITGSNVAIDGGFPTGGTGAGTSRRTTWQSTWAAGTATNAAIAEAVVTNLSPIGTGAGAAADTVSRVTFTAINKTATDSLVITWQHDLGS